MLAGEETSEMPRIVDRPGLQTLAVYIRVFEARRGKEACPEVSGGLDSASWLFGFSEGDPHTHHAPLGLGLSISLYVLNLLSFIYLKQSLT